MEVKRAQLLARHHEAPHLLVGAKINNLRAREIMTKGGGTATINERGRGDAKNRSKDMGGRARN